MTKGGVALAGIIAVIAGYGVWNLQGQTTSTAPASAQAALVQIVVPERLTDRAQIGKAAYDAKCAACHGVNAVGQAGVAPPLIHKIYEPSHHGDESFQRAVALGVQAHHWPFGDMPAVDGLTRADVAMIATYIRDVQVANGIN